MSKALVAIGVSKAPPLETLAGAVRDANRIAAWARSTGYEHVYCFTDEVEGSSVTGKVIFDCCSEILKIDGLERLVIFFAGHGYSPVPLNEVWLLSDWNSDANQAINATASVQIAQRFERPQIAFLVDACRVTWNEAQGTTGQVILPKAKPPSSDSQVDTFYATKFGDASQEFEPAQMRASFGIFSDVLLAGLQGAAAERRDRKLVVTSRSLQDYLRESVPAACRGLRGAFVQHPDTNPQWRKPHDIYVEFPDLPQPRLVPMEPPEEEREIDLVESGLAFMVRGNGELPSTSETPSKRDQDIKDKSARFQEAIGRISFETGTGISLVGAEPARIVISEGQTESFVEDGVWQIRVLGDRHYIPTTATTMALQIAAGRWAGHWIAVPVFPGLIGTVVIDLDGFSSLNYRRANQDPHDSDMNRIMMIEAALSEAAAMLRYGRIPDPAHFRSIVGVMRDNKLDNPALAIVAAYVCQSAGDLGQIFDMQHYDIGRGPYTPFDLSLITGQKPIPNDRILVGSFPFMSSGWGMLQSTELEYDQRLLKVVGGLTPSLWTMADPSAGAIIADVVAENDFSMA